MKYTIEIDNLKCSGCAHSITQAIQKIPNVLGVHVDVDKDLVEIDAQEELEILKVKEKLSSMGYPEKGTLEGISKLTANAKSFVSCAIGKVTK